MVAAEGVSLPDGQRLLIARAFLVGVLACALAAVPAAASEGARAAVLDRGFGAHGVSSIPAGGAPSAVAAAATGEIVVVGGDGDGAWVTRLRRNGSPDTEFAGGVARPLPDDAVLESALAVPDGSVVVGGRFVARGSDPFVARIRPDGGLDASFGDGGVRRFPETPPAVTRDRAFAATTVISLGRHILVELPGLAVARLEQDGSRDPTFGTDGIATAPDEGRALGAAGLVPMPDGGVVAVARFSAAEPESGLNRSGTVLARYDARGSFDRRYGRGRAGGRSLPETRGFQATSVAPRPDGSATVAGFGDCRADILFFRDVPCGALLRRLEPDGALRSAGFGLPPTSLEPQIRRYATVVEQRGGVLALGSAISGRPFSRRYLADGSPATRYGACGTRTGPGSLRVRAAAETPAAALAVAGLRAGKPAVQLWRSAAARSGRFGEALATVRHDVELEPRDAAERGVRVRARFTRAVRLALRARVAGGRSRPATHLTLRACETARVRLRLARADRSRIARSPETRVVVEATARDRRGLLLRRTTTAAG